MTTTDVQSYQLNEKELDGAIRDRILSKDPAQPFSVMALSGGTANGAWGAGWIYGWGESGKRPTFDIVTGISTGAMQSTFAFLGTPADDQTLLTSFTTVTTDQIYRDRFFLFVPFSSSLKDTAPLKRLIASTITDATIDRVAAAAAEHRKLYVASMNLRTGELARWDLTRMAQDHQYDLYRTIILASAAIPVFFPPVDVGGDLQADGGTGALVFFHGDVLPRLRQVHRNLADVASTRPARAPSTQPALYTIVNGNLIPGTGQPSDWILSLGIRALDCLMTSSDMATLELVQLRAVEYHYDCYLSYIPKNAPQLPDSTKFVPAQMNALFQFARAQGRAAGTTGNWLGAPAPASPTTQPGS